MGKIAIQKMTNMNVYIDGVKVVTLEGNYAELAAAFETLVDNYVATKYPPKAPATARVSS